MTACHSNGGAAREPHDCAFGGRGCGDFACPRCCASQSTVARHARTAKVGRLELRALSPSCAIWTVYHLWPASLGVGAAWFSALTTAIIVSAGFGMIDVRMYRHLKTAVDSASEKQRRRRVNIYAGAFVIASLVGVVVT